MKGIFHFVRYGGREDHYFLGTPSRSHELLQLLRDCFGGAVPATTDGHFGLAKFQNKLDRAPVIPTPEFLKSDCLLAPSNCLSLKV